MTNPILFLDIDGVLNGKGSFDEIAMSSTIDPACVSHLNSALDRVPECKVVLSSSWRYMMGFTAEQRGPREWFGQATLRGFEYLLRTHRLHVADRLIGMTASDEEIPQRGDQILAFAQDFQTWAAIDDEVSTSMDKLWPRLVRTNPDTGMTAADADRLVKVLGGAIDPRRLEITRYYCEAQGVEAPLDEDHLMKGWRRYPADVVRELAELGEPELTAIGRADEHGGFHLWHRDTATNGIVVCGVCSAPVRRGPVL